MTFYDYDLLEVEDVDGPVLQLNDKAKLNRDVKKLRLKKSNGRVDYRKSRQGIAPNVIHSQDGLMLQMAVCLCDEEDLNDIMVVHDSFATTIADVGKMRQLVLLAMRDLYHKYDLWTDIREQVVARLDNPESVEMIKEMPDRTVGTLVIDDILKSNYALA